MRRAAPSTCPVCDARLRVARLECERCHTAIEGDFDRGRLGRLSREELAFVEVFLECRGKIKDVEQRLGLSYPTVVSRLDQVVNALGPPRSSHADDAEGTHGGAPHATHATQIDDVLEALARGDLSPTEAAERLKRARKKRGHE